MISEKNIIERPSQSKWRFAFLIFACLGTVFHLPKKKY